MKVQSLGNMVSIGKGIIRNYVNEGDIVLDATVGNGNDTKLLAELVGASGYVYGFDLQELAIENTSKLLRENNLLNRVSLIKDSHENIIKHVNKGLDFIVYNLGYLPGGDKSIITQEDTSIKSIRQSLDLLNKGGILMIIAYIGHQGGLDEMLAIEGLLSKLEQKDYSVLRSSFINQVNNPPILFLVEKR